MAQIAAKIMKNEEFPKKLSMTLVLDENDSIIESLKTGLKENNIREATIVGVSGKIKQAVIQFMDRGILKTEEISNSEILRASGLISLSGGALFGRMNISAGIKGVTSGTVLKGTAKERMQIHLTFFK